MYEESARRRAIWVAGPTALFLAVVVIVFLATSHLGRNESPTSGPRRDDVPSITSEEAIGVVKEWIAGGTELGAAQEFVSSLPCAGYFQGGSTWQIRCRLPWMPVEGYFFTLSEVSGEVKPETEATLSFVQLLREWGHVPKP